MMLWVYISAVWAGLIVGAFIDLLYSLMKVSICRKDIRRIKSDIRKTKTILKHDIKRHNEFKQRQRRFKNIIDGFQ